MGNLLIAIDGAIPEVELALGVISWVLAVPYWGSVAGVAAAVMGVILVYCVKFTFGSCAKIVVVTKFVKVGQVTKVYSILRINFHIACKLSMQLKYFVIFLRIQSLGT